MKKIKFGICSCLLLPTIASPVILSGCSVYQDLMTEYKPKYEQLSQTKLTLEQARDKWFDASKTTSNFIEQEINWGYSKRALSTWSLDVAEIPGVSYKGEFSFFSTSINNARVSNYDKHNLSYKLNAEVEEKDTYSYNGVFAGTGVCHYTIEWDIQNIEFDICKDSDKTIRDAEFWLVKPSFYVPSEEGGYKWTRILQNDERIAFNIRYVIEIYNTDGIQSYGFETTEASVMDKDLSYVAEMEYILNYICCFRSYYLDNCISE